MKDKRNEKSHIYIPKGILRKFEDERHQIFFIFDDYKKIFSAYPKSFNTEVGHFSNDNEDILNKLSENKFISLISKISKNINENKDVYLSDEDRLVVLKYLTYQFIRNDYLYDYVNSINQVKFPIKELKNFMVSKESKYNIVWDVVKDLSVQMMVNTTKSKFLMPITSTITLNSDSQNDFVLILFATPSIAFNLYSNDFLTKKKVMSNVHIIEEAVRGINLKMLYILEKEKNNKVIGCKPDLEIAIKSFNNKEKTVL